ncbi:ependymin-like [Conger conger]|uniref:ependymin-like n=1 Tax=Conger conger TaxID=82655 RepID=UPI002A59B878|nr:ependymin-like [Conger conger]
MHLLISLSVCLLLAVTAVAQKPHPCKSPPLMVGRASVIYPKGETYVSERFTYDALGKKIRVRMEGVEHNHSFYEDVLMLFGEGVIYQISYRNKTCTKKPLKVPFQPIEIPQNATLQAQIILGSSSGPGQGLLVNNWMGEIPEQKVKYFATFTEFGCIPVSTLYLTHKDGWLFSSFFNILVGIDDPQDLIPPDFCDTTKPVDNEQVVTDFFEALKKN